MGGYASCEAYGVTDFLTKTQRSVLMSAIRGRGNRTTEMAFAAILRRHRITGWRRHPTIAGRPDFVFNRSRVAIFIDGCYWHGCRWHSHVPTSNTDFWKAKFARNRERDRRVSQVLRADGWKVLRLWEHQLKHEQSVVNRVQTLLASRAGESQKPRRSHEKNMRAMKRQEF
jgi:DNA mismatch endonuclease (patch repair protein)